MTRINHSIFFIGILSLALLAAGVGCVGVEGEGYVGPAEVDVGGPDVYVFGGYGHGFDHHHDFDRRASVRGAASRGGGFHGGGGRHR